MKLGLHQPSDAKHFNRVFVSVTRLSGHYGRKRKFTDQPWIMDSGAFTTIARHGGYPKPVSGLREQIRRWAGPNLVAVVAQDFMCEAIHAGQDRADHRRSPTTDDRTLDELSKVVGGVYLMPVLQGYALADYVRASSPYGDRLASQRLCWRRLRLQA